MKCIFSIMTLFFSTTILSQNPLTIPIWPNGTKEDNGITLPEEIIEGGRLLNCRTAEMYVYLPDEEINTGTAVLICPGGGYARQAMQHEGYDFAKLLNRKGIAGIVLKYRLPNGHANIPLSDAKEAMRIIREKAAEWNINPHQIGISGFSAGGHLAATLGTHFEEQNRPDFMILFYPVITMNNRLTHKGSKENLLGNGIEDDNFSNEKQIRKTTPPTLLLLSDDDKSVPPANSILFYNGLKEKGIKASLHIFPSGGHGWGCNKDFPYYQIWQELLFNWLNTQDLLNKK
ncbi:alpha/beta hydrolase [Coprobacter sp.]